MEIQERKKADLFVHHKDKAIKVYKLYLDFVSRFENALNNKGKLTLTTPYLDPFGAGFLVDIVHSLYEGKSSRQHDASDEVVAVLDGSLDLFRFYR